MKVYTKMGDEGKTTLFGGPPVSKSNERLNAYGSVDELNSHVGLLRCLTKHLPIDNQLEVIQHRLFQVGSHLACGDESLRNQLPAFKALFKEELELQIDEASKKLPELKNFILPGGSEASCHAHICRTICRRAERELFSLESLNSTEKEIGRYLNRLSDYFFIFARWLNVELKVSDVMWRKER
ncbi:MAG: cob(I)yrinic acid a,c-diamide adenosyltransferase [Bdellovibrionales bacterium]|nr:cob(I)yrinic acid a,c-diamide adenosyltransferase [Bdellovibrionales bacterium]